MDDAYAVQNTKKYLEQVQRKISKSEVSSNKIYMKILPYLFLSPAFFFFVTFYYFPFIKTIYMSMTITNAVGQIKKFVGLDNFIRIFSRADFVPILLTTLKFVPMIAIPSIFIGLVLALMAVKKVHSFSRVYEVLYSLPMAVSSASAAIVWMMIYNSSVGILNLALHTNIQWLTDPKWALFSVAVVTIWLQFGTNFIFLLAGLRAVPEELNESATIDGANGFQKFFSVTLPMFSPTLFFVTFYNIMASFQAFGQIRLLTEGGPGISTKVLVYDIYQEAFMNYRYGAASAESIILFFIMLSVALLQFRFEKKGVHYN